MLFAGSWLGALQVHLLFLANLTLLLIPGLAAVSLLPLRMRCDRVLGVVVMVATGALLSYSSFWIFFASKRAGRVFTFVVYLVALAVLGRFCRRISTLLPTLATPLGFVALAGVLYLSLFCLFGDAASQGAGLANGRFFRAYRPGDNLIPLIFADRIYDHAPLHPFCCGDWLSSDRPPLQSGIVLLLRPLRPVRSLALQYQAASTAAQCLWVAGVWCLLTSLRSSPAAIRRILVLLILSGFLFFNSVFVWPKLLAAAFVLFVCALLVEQFRQPKPAAIYFVMAAVSLSLGMLAHPGSVFSVPIIFATVLLSRKRPSLRVLALSAVVALLLLLPWSAYQRFVDPPGNRLVKMHLAGAFDIDQRPVFTALQQAYGSLSLSSIAVYKWTNLQTIIGPDPGDSFGLFLRDHEESRIAQREYIWNAIGLLNLGWIGYLLSRICGRAVKPAFPYALWFFPIAIGNLIIWALVVFGPHATYTTHSSYADILLLAVASAGLVVSLPRLFGYLVMCLEIWNLLAVWTWSAPLAFFPHPQPLLPFLVTAMVALVALIAVYAGISAPSLEATPGKDPSLRRAP